MDIIARHAEKRLLDDILRSGQPEFVAVYGRRRVGKTYLIENFFRDRCRFFSLTGAPNESRQEQLWHFAIRFEDVFGGGGASAPVSWQQAFDRLRRGIEATGPGERIVVFLDELPWLAKKRSGFVAALTYLWNQYLQADPRVILIVCGSAASWMISNVINERGGLYNRLTRRIRLLPLSLGETELYLRGKGVRLSRKQVTEVYMGLGGIPAYLNLAHPGKSSAQILGEAVFDENSILKGEFDRLLKSLFTSSESHARVVRALARKRMGMARGELFAAAGITSSSTQTRVLRELSESGFIAESRAFGRRRRGALYRLTDEFSIFHLGWASREAGGLVTGPAAWRAKQTSPAWRAWSGFAFEAVCMKHLQEVSVALGIHGIAFEWGAWRCPASDESGAGVQIDLLIDRADACINLCEIKFHADTFVIDRDYAGKLQHRRRTFAEMTGTRKAVFTTMITAHGVRRNEHYLDCVDSEVTLDDLFRLPPESRGNGW